MMQQGNQNSPQLSTDSNRPRRTRALATLMICTACMLTLGPASVSSSAPREAATTMPVPGGDRFGPRRERDGGQRPPPSAPMQPPPTTQERDEVIEFFRTNMKTRMFAFDQMPEGRPAKNRMLQMMTERYRRLQRIKADDPVVYDLMVSQMSLQDDALSIMRDQRNPNIDAAKRDELEQQLRDKVKQLIDVTLKERRQRVERLEKMLQEQKARLEQDEANPGALIDQHLKQMKTDAAEFRSLWPGRRGGGPGMGGAERRPQPTTDHTEPTDQRR
jgi:hypothetical protein